MAHLGDAPNDGHGSISLWVLQGHSGGGFPRGGALGSPEIFQAAHVVGSAVGAAGPRTAASSCSLPLCQSLYQCLCLGLCASACTCVCACAGACFGACASACASVSAGPVPVSVPGPVLCHRGNGSPGEYPRWMRGRQMPSPVPVPVPAPVSGPVPMPVPGFVPVPVPVSVPGPVLQCLYPCLCLGRGLVSCASACTGVCAWACAPVPVPVSVPGPVLQCLYRCLCLGLCSSACTRVCAWAGAWFLVPASARASASAGPVPVSVPGPVLCRRGSGAPGKYPRWMRGRQMPAPVPVPVPAPVSEPVPMPVASRLQYESIVPTWRYHCPLPADFVAIRSCRRRGSGATCRYHCRSKLPASRFGGCIATDIVAIRSCRRRGSEAAFLQISLLLEVAGVEVRRLPCCRYRCHSKLPASRFGGYLSAVIVATRVCQLHFCRSRCQSKLPVSRFVLSLSSYFVQCHSAHLHHMIA